MSDPTFSDIDFKNKMGWVWTTLKMKNVHGSLSKIYHRVYDPSMVKNEQFR